jgi:hypothetical protein
LDLAKFADKTTKPAPNTLTFFKTLGVALLKLLALAGGMAAASKRPLVLPGSSCCISTSFLLRGAQKIIQSKEKYHHRFSSISIECLRVRNGVGGPKVAPVTEKSRVWTFLLLILLQLQSELSCINGFQAISVMSPLVHIKDQYLFHKRSSPKQFICLSSWPLQKDSCACTAAQEGPKWRKLRHSFT